MADRTSDDLDSLLDQYFLGELDADTAKRVRDALAATAGRRGAIAGLHAATRGELTAMAPPPAERATRDFLARLDREHPPTVVAPLRPLPGRRRGESPWMRHRAPWAPIVGAVAALVLCVFAIPSVRTTAGDVLGITSSPSVASEYHTGRGEQRSVVLGDGATVMLAPETRIQYRVDATGARVVDLTGEAFLTVTPSSRRPFVVRTGTITTRVLGTRFDVRRYPRDRATQVAVLSGRVASGSGTRPAVLAAGAIGHITDSTAIVNTNGDPERAVAWTQGALAFDDTPVPVMLTTLGRWYGYDFQLADTTLAARSVTIAFRTNQVTETMNALKALLSVTMTFHGDTVTLVPDRGNASASHRLNTRELPRARDREVGK